MLPTAQLDIPDLLLEGEGRVSSASFGDVYFSRASGAEETRHVFLGGNGLPGRFAGSDSFTIGELGFGTGLNFLVAHRAFLEATNNAQHLHYISVEKCPLTREQFAALHPEATALLEQYPLRLPGWHRIHLERCTLTLGFGDAEELLGGMDTRVDAWFLDGFAPAKNAAMWSDALLGDVARLTVPGGSFATFTAAGFVKRSLSSHGFAVEKTRGFAHKRDMLIGTMAARPPIARAPIDRSALVIGAGIAGCTAARALAERGLRVTVLENHTVASAASGNPSAVLFPQLTKYYTPATEWHLTGYALMLRNLKRWNIPHHQPGILLLPRHHDAQTSLGTLRLDPAIARYVTQAEGSMLARTEVAGDGMFLPHGTWLNPAETCRQLLQHENIMLHENCEVKALTREGNHWHIETTLQSFNAKQVVVSTAQQTHALLPHLPMPIAISAGQVSLFARQDFPLQCIVSQYGYVIPSGEQLLVGATYDHHDHSMMVTEENHDVNQQHARSSLPSWQERPAIGGRSALRATTPDRLPYVGQVGEGLYVSVGHGSRGMISAPLAAEVIASQIAGEMLPLTPALRNAINPLRRAHVY